MRTISGSPRCRSVTEPSRAAVRAEHHTTWRRHRLHPLQPFRPAHRWRCTQRTRTDLTGDHLTGVQAHTHPQVHTVASWTSAASRFDLALEHPRRARQATNSMVLQRHGAPNTAMMPSPVKLPTVPPYRLHHRRAKVDQIGHDLAQPLRTDGRRDVHRMHNIGEQHRYLLVLRRLGGLSREASPHSLQNLAARG